MGDGLPLEAPQDVRRHLPQPRQLGKGGGVRHLTVDPVFQLGVKLDAFQRHDGL